MVPCVSGEMELGIGLMPGIEFVLEDGFFVDVFCVERRGVAAEDPEAIKCIGGEL